MHRCAWTPEARFKRDNRCMGHFHGPGTVISRITLSIGSIIQITAYGSSETDTKISKGETKS